MYLQDYVWFMGAIVLCMILAGIASSKVKSTFNKYSHNACRSGLTGADAALRLLRSNGASDIGIGKVGGELSDHYNPKNSIVNLSESTYSSSSVSAVAVAAHEIGHVMQNKEGYAFYNFRAALVPIANFGSRFSFVLVILGLFLDYTVRFSNPDTGFYIAMLGVALYGTSFLFSLVTLPVELDASRRAINMLLDSHIISEDEAPAARKVLSAAAFTYVVSLLMSFVYFLRFLIYVLSVFGKRRR